MAEIPQVSLVDGDDKADIVHQRVSPSPFSWVLGLALFQGMERLFRLQTLLAENLGRCKSCQSSSLVKLLWDQHGDFCRRLLHSWYCFRFIYDHDSFLCRHVMWYNIHVYWSFLRDASDQGRLHPNSSDQLGEFHLSMQSSPRYLPSCHQEIPS